MQTQTFSHIPGLYFIPAFFSPQESRALVTASLALYQALEAAYDPRQLKAAHIPQPELVSQQPGALKAQESFSRVKLALEGQRIGCEYFPAYGERGHALAYFRGNANLPRFVQTQAQQALLRWLVAHELVATGLDDGALSWRMMLNVYQRIDDQIAGFPFHVDIPVHGTITAIMNIHREALFQIVEPEQDTPTELALPVGSALVLSGPSRYEWSHRVLPITSQGPSGEVARVSLVLGVRQGHAP